MDPVVLELKKLVEEVSLMRRELAQAMSQLTTPPPMSIQDIMAARLQATVVSYGE